MSVLSEQANQADWVRVSSSNIFAAAYVADFKRLFIRYLDGSLYYYDDVEERIWDAFLVAPSKGKFRHQVLSPGKFPYGQV